MFCALNRSFWSRRHPFVNDCSMGKIPTFVCSCACILSSHLDHCLERQFMHTCFYSWSQTKQKMAIKILKVKFNGLLSWPDFINYFLSYPHISSFRSLMILSNYIGQKIHPFNTMLKMDQLNGDCPLTFVYTQFNIFSINIILPRLY